jgi:plasmid stabilization system protein ParE
VKRFRVRISERADRQLSELERWIEGEASVPIARRYREAIVAHCFTLETFPSRGTPKDHLRSGLRTIGFRGRVSIAYVVDGNDVVIVAIAGAGRDMLTALKDVGDADED